MATKTKTKQTFDVKTVDTPSDLVAVNDSQLGLFDYSGYSEEFKLKSYERKARIKANEQVATKAFYDIAQDVKAQHDEMNNYQDWLKWCRDELDYKDRMAESLLKIGKELPHYSAVDKLPKSYKGLLAIADSLSKADEETKEEILTAVEQKTEKKGKALTEKEINDLPEIKELKEKLKAEQEAKKQAEEAKKKAEQTELNLTAQLAVVLSERDNLKVTSENQNKQIQELNSNISAKQKALDEIQNLKEELEDKQLNLESFIIAQASVMANDEINKEKEVLDKQIKELKAKEAKLEKELKQAESLRVTAQKQKENFDLTTSWLNSFQLTNEYLNEITGKLKQYKKELEKTPDLSQFDDEERSKLEKAIQDQVVDFNDNLHKLGGAINYLNGTVVKFNNHALRVINAEVSE